MVRCSAPGGSLGLSRFNKWSGALHLVDYVVCFTSTNGPVLRTCYLYTICIFRVESRQTQSFVALTTQKETIRNIACQCPLAGGNAVYLARSLYSVFVDTIYNDKQLCQQAGINYKNSKIADKESNFRLYPNPANTLLTVQWDNGSDNFGVFYIVNSIGQPIKSDNFNFSKGQVVLDISDLPAGLYKLYNVQMCKLFYFLSFLLLSELRNNNRAVSYGSLVEMFEPCVIARPLQGGTNNHHYIPTGILPLRGN